MAAEQVERSLKTNLEEIDPHLEGFLAKNWEIGEKHQSNREHLREIQKEHPDLVLIVIVLPRTEGIHPEVLQMDKEGLQGVQYPEEKVLLKEIQRQTEDEEEQQHTINERINHVFF
eukprot:TRINITY_DN1864_c0_g1_i2.p1 TRINITY_DN1864_c0_g1~~TRINITY_DN1864_c0_g1_i2.p1  ORF type:complete len:116 (+),score=19.03 TRINITY_DN1864_c0_g1_i2:478-825(+)